MAKFARQVEFTAYQFNQKQVQGLPAHDIEDIIITALEVNDPMPVAFLTTKDQLVVTLYTKGKESSPETFELSPGEWLTDKGTELYTVLSDTEFQKLNATIR